MRIACGDGQISTCFQHMEHAISCTLMSLDDRSTVISMKYDAINVTVKQLKTRIFDFQRSSRYRLDYGYLAGATKGAAWIWTVPPFRNAMLLVLTAHAINLSPTLAGASVGGTWRVASVRCQVAVRSGEWQVSGVRWRCAVQAYV